MASGRAGNRFPSTHIQFGDSELPLVFGGAAILLAAGYVIGSGRWSRLQPVIGRLAADIGILTVRQVMNAMKKTQAGGENESSEEKPEKGKATGF